MKNGFALIAVALAIAVGLYYAHNEKRPADGLVKSICVAPIQNLSHKAVPMDGIDDEFVAQLHQTGFESRKTSAGVDVCDATTRAEVVDVSGHGRKTARLDFRLILTGEQVPRLSDSVEGMSSDVLDGDFATHREAKLTAEPEREAIVAALQKTAAEIDAANRRGLAPKGPR